MNILLVNRCILIVWVNHVHEYIIPNDTSNSKHDNQNGSDFIFRFGKLSPHAVEDGHRAEREHGAGYDDREDNECINVEAENTNQGANSEDKRTNTDDKYVAVSVT